MNSTVRKTDEEQYFTQKELAKRWKVSEGTIKNWRDRSIIKKYLRVAGSTRVFYPVDYIIEFEEQHTITAKEVANRDRKAELKREKPVVSTKPKKEWRV